MNDSDVDELGPVDYVVVEFPADQANFSGEMTAELEAVVKSGVVRVLDLLFVTKNADGSVEGFESHDFGEGGRVERAGGQGHGCGEQRRLEHIFQHGVLPVDAAPQLRPLSVNAPKPISGPFERAAGSLSGSWWQETRQTGILFQPSPAWLLLDAK